MNRTISALAFCLLAGMATVAYSEDNAPVSRVEYDKLKAEHEQLIKEMAELKTEMKQVMQKLSTTAPRTAEQKLSDPLSDTPLTAPSVAAFQDLSDDVEGLKERVNEAAPKFTLSGWGTARLISNNETIFSADFHPIFLFNIAENFSFEGELDFYHSNNSTSINLETAALSYAFTECMTVDAGRFVNPANYFAAHFLNPVNKLPDSPLAVAGSLMPGIEDGAQVSGLIPIGPTKLKYSGFLAAAPVTEYSGNFWDSSELEEDSAGRIGQNIGVGGYVGLVPIPGLEIGYGVQEFKVQQHIQTEQTAIVWTSPYDWRRFDWSDNYSPAATPAMQSLNLSYVKDSKFLKGIFNLEAQWIWLSVGENSRPTGYAYDYGMYPYNSPHDGGYVQLSYRPIHLCSPVRNLEPVIRFDSLNAGATTFGNDEERWTFGLDCWLTKSVALNLKT